MFRYVPKTCFLETLEVLGRLAHAILNVFGGSVWAAQNAYKTNAFEASSFLLRRGVFYVFVAFVRIAIETNQNGYV